jgi:hypothetical protein
VARPVVEGCDLGLELSCPKRWEALAPTRRDDVRRCHTCRKDVVFCTSLIAARAIARKGGCVAIDPSLARRANDLATPQLIMGRFVPRADDAEPLARPLGARRG